MKDQKKFIKIGVVFSGLKLTRRKKFCWGLKGISGGNEGKKENALRRNSVTMGGKWKKKDGVVVGDVSG